MTAGAAEAFWLLARVVRARRAVCVHPSFTAPEAALRGAGGTVDHGYRRPETDWRLEPEAIPADVDVVVLGNPNNPTGTLDEPDRIAALCRPGRVVVVDEAFMDFVDDPAASLVGRDDLPGLVVVRSVTKLWGLAGLRAGYFVAPAGLAARCEAARQPWSVGVDALDALARCLADEPYRRDVAAEVAARRTELRTALAALPGVTVWDSAANFVLVRVPGGAKVHQRLLERHIAVRPSTFPGLDSDHLRITVRDRERHQMLVDTLAACLPGADHA